MYLKIYGRLDDLPPLHTNFAVSQYFPLVCSKRDDQLNISKCSDISKTLLIDIIINRSRCYLQWPVPVTNPNTHYPFHSEPNTAGFATSTHPKSNVLFSFALTRNFVWSYLTRLPADRENAVNENRKTAWTSKIDLLLD